MKSNGKKRALYFLYILDALLFALLIFKFLPVSNLNAPKSYETVLLNPSKIDKIGEISITEHNTNERSLIFKKTDESLWIGSDSDTDYEVFWPCDRLTVGNFILKMSQNVSVRTVSQKKENWDSYGVDERSSVEVRVLSKDGSDILRVFFGASDKLTNRIAFRTDRTPTVWDMADEVGIFLTCEKNFWCDGFLVPSFLHSSLNNENTEQPLRRGNLCIFTPSKIQDADDVFCATLLNGNKTILNVYKNAENYFVKPSFVPYDPQKSGGWNILNYTYEISGWTFLKLSDYFEKLK